MRRIRGGAWLLIAVAVMAAMVAAWSLQAEEPIDLPGETDPVVVDGRTSGGTFEP